MKRHFIIKQFRICINGQKRSTGRFLILVFDIFCDKVLSSAAIFSVIQQVATPINVLYVCVVTANVVSVGAILRKSNFVKRFVLYAQFFGLANFDNIGGHCDVRPTRITVDQLKLVTEIILSLSPFWSKFGNFVNDFWKCMRNSFPYEENEFFFSIKLMRKRNKCH